MLGGNSRITGCNGGTAKGVWWALAPKPEVVMGNGNFMVILFFSPFLMSLSLPYTAGRSRQGEEDIDNGGRGSSRGADVLQTLMTATMLPPLLIAPWAMCHFQRYRVPQQP